MAERTFTIPFRGKVKRVRADGHVIAGSDGIGPIDLLRLAMADPSVRKQPEISCGMSNYNFQTATVDCTIVCDDAGFLDDLENMIANTPNLRAAEIVLVGAPERAELEAGLTIKATDLTRWKKAHAKR